MIFTGFLNFSRIDRKFDDLKKKNALEIENIKQEIYLQTLQRFNDLKSKHIININYILPDDTIFLSMTNPLKKEKKFSEKRLILKKAQKQKKSIDSYEIGKNGSGFRFVHPIFKDKKYLGLISITFSEQAITSSIMKQYDVLCNIIISDKNFNKELLKTSSRYKKAHFTGFLHNIDVIKQLEENAKKKVFQIKPKKETSKKIYNQAMKKSSKSFFVEKTDMIVTTIPIIHKLSKEQEAFISILSKGEAINILNNNYFAIFALLIFLYISIILLFLQQKIKALIDKETMEEILKKDKQLLEQAKLAQMGEMIGNIAHQWRQPLSAISTVASGTKLNYEYDLLKPEDIPKNMDTIVENTKYLSETIDTFRDFIKDNKVEKKVVIQKKIDESLKILSASLKDNHIKLIKEIDYNKPILSVMIAEEFSQVIINIINNAKDAITQNQIEDGWIKITLKQKDNLALILIEDNAKGINEDIIEKIFDPYFTTKHQYQGTGLGLYMSKTIIENHLKGELLVSNTKNGAQFTIKLKIYKEDLFS